MVVLIYTKKREGYTLEPWECGNIPFPPVHPSIVHDLPHFLDNCPIASCLVQQLTSCLGVKPIWLGNGEMAVDKRGKRSEKSNYAITFSSHGRTNSRLELQYSMGSSKFHFLSSPQILLPKTVHGRWRCR